MTIECYLFNYYRVFPQRVYKRVTQQQQQQQEKVAQQIKYINRILLNV
jgi:hypothetical protein